MKKVIIFFVLSIFFLAGCENTGKDPLKQFCEVAEDCEKYETILDCVGEWACQNKQCVFECGTGKGNPYLQLQVEPISGTAPLQVTFQADLFDVEGYEEEYYCTSTTWDFGEGEKLTAIPSCIPYEEAKKQDDFIQLSYEEQYTYEKPGTYSVSFALGNLQSQTILITVIDKKQQQCKEDNDCVPAECCHPRYVVNKKYAPQCEGIACTESCEGPLDCGAGHPACEKGICVIVADNPQY
tara:strand:- start:47292 stop:48008 length:717 start_codon:yes stop_codon:yes gene_type:complete